MWTKVKSPIIIKANPRLMNNIPKRRTKWLKQSTPYPTRPPLDNERKQHPNKFQHNHQFHCNHANEGVRYNHQFQYKYTRGAWLVFSFRNFPRVEYLLQEDLPFLLHFLKLSSDAKDKYMLTIKIIFGMDKGKF